MLLQLITFYEHNSFDLSDLIMLKCYNCRYRRRLRAAEEDIEDVNIVPKRPNYYSIRIVPDNTNPELVMFCRRAYEFRTKRLLKMPNKQDYYVVTS